LILVDPGDKGISQVYYVMLLRQFLRTTCQICGEFIFQQDRDASAHTELRTINCLAQYFDKCQPILKTLSKKLSSKFVTN